MFRSLIRRIDQSRMLTKLLANVSTRLARRRGLPILIGIVLFVIGFIFQLIQFVAPDSSRLLEFLSLLFTNGGVLVALIGLLLAEPLGR